MDIPKQNPANLPAPANPPAPANLPAPANPPAPAMKSSLQDVITACLAVSIAAVTLVLMVQCFKDAGSTVTGLFANEKDILTIAVSLIGTVTGYYFGRTPAEKQAQQAQQNAQQANQTTKETQDRLAGQQDKTVAAVAGQAQAQQKAETVKALVVQELTALTAGPDPSRPAPAPPTPQEAQVQARLAGLLQRVNQVS